MQRRSFLFGTVAAIAAPALPAYACGGTVAGGKYIVGFDLASGPSMTAWTLYHKMNDDIWRQIAKTTGIRFDHLANNGVLEIA